MVWIWAGVFIFTLIFEIITTELVSIWFTFGSFVAFILALLNVGVNVQIIVFLVVSTLLLASLRAIFMKFLKNNREKTNLDLIIGKTLTLQKAISEDEYGEVKVNGIVWNVTTKDRESINVGERVRIVEVQGNKFIVKREKENG